MQRLSVARFGLGLVLAAGCRPLAARRPPPELPSWKYYNFQQRRPAQLLQAHTNESNFVFVELVGRGSDVGVVRTAHLTTDDGAASTILTLDVWHTTEGGLIASAWQCWQLVPLAPASDDLPVSPREGLFAETVREALEGLAQLQAAELFVAQYWTDGYRGVVDGVRMDAKKMHRHVAALQVTRPLCAMCNPPLAAALRLQLSRSSPPSPT